jgi:hypothetical protein
MKNLLLALLAASAATLVIVAAPAFAGHSDDVHNWWGDGPGIRCHYVREQFRMPDGRVVYQVYRTNEVCN